MPSCLKEDHITVTSSSIEIKKNAPPALDSRSPVTSKPSGTKVSFKRARRPLSPRLYDTKRRKMKYTVRQQPDNVGVSQSAGTSQTVDTSQSKDDSLSVESSAACSTTNSTGSTPIQLLGEVTPSPVKRRRRSPGDVPRCRCGTNHPQVLHKICARGKCPCFSQGIACIRCLCRHCHNPINQSQWGVCNCTGDPRIFFSVNLNLYLLLHAHAIRIYICSNVIMCAQRAIARSNSWSSRNNNVGEFILRVVCCSSTYLFRRCKSIFVSGCIVVS